MRETTNRCDACVAPENCARIGRCLATPPQAAPEPLYLVVEYQGPLGDWRGDAYRTRVRLTPEICRRIVAMAGVPVPEEGGR